MVLCGAVLKRVVDVFEQELEAGLREQPSSLQMENTYVPELPNGTGAYLCHGTELVRTFVQICFCQVLSSEAILNQICCPTMICTVKKWLGLVRSNHYLKLLAKSDSKLL